MTSSARRVPIVRFATFSKTDVLTMFYGALGTDGQALSVSHVAGQRQDQSISRLQLMETVSSTGPFRSGSY